MVALPDTSQMTAQIRPDKATAPKTVVLRQAVKMVAGTSLILSAVGVWLLPSGAGDAAMQLIKLVFSFSMLGLGVMCISAMDQPDDEPEIEFDTINRQLRIVEFDNLGHPAVTSCHDLDSLSELNFQDGSLTARDADGNQVVALSIHSKTTERALRAAINDAG
ncbi:hypothetical protein PEL8287_03526 [Roseovarius litorisediminis]|uniref:Uncharacterized protein n=1 Tax=Roseovarius litorisediminis TaxID=1312363 RepID=A0A1Y5THI7_9RHOB|nr:hypothetical protein [Roseovarius litorisediminis]SLN64208.1 hypothetical protein PEL8287_03526 [Roseovarius litorisediminis]